MAKKKEGQTIMNQIKELQENIEYWESVKHDTESAIRHQNRRLEQAEKAIQRNSARLEEIQEERAKQLKHGHKLAEHLRSIADSIEGSGVVDAYYNHTNTGITPLHHDGSSPTITWLDSGARRLELNYTVPKN